MLSPIHVSSNQSNASVASCHAGRARPPRTRKLRARSERRQCAARTSAAIAQCGRGLVGGRGGRETQRGGRGRDRGTTVNNDIFSIIHITRTNVSASTSPIIYCFYCYLEAHVSNHIRYLRLCVRLICRSSICATRSEPIAAALFLHFTPAAQCCVCMDASATHAGAPCGHRCVCAACAMLAMSACPVCRDPITRFERVPDA